MRKQFAEFLHEEMSYNPSIVILTGDLGYGLWDKIKIDYPDRFYNVMSSEQLMLGAAEDIKILSTLENIKLYKPKKATKLVYQDFLYNHKPSYLNLKR